ncbi:DNA polymerase II [Shewanella olleyana]|uniref:DNA polymerase II n=1 Tax=Shewanella olleyana TaxID=135626 RepID=UPI00200C966F|nr:DNA polymerase II [Shewanella olleyana]MCL1065382.1 DNA polymerase II [Shewanella olleyana]
MTSKSLQDTVLQSDNNFLSIKGRVLTRHARYLNGKLLVQYFLKTESGPCLVEIEQAEVICFCKQQDTALILSHFNSGIRIEPIKLKNFNHQQVSCIYLKSTTLQKQLLRIANDAGIEIYEADIRVEQRYLIERFIALDAEFIVNGALPRDINKLQNEYQQASSLNVAKALPKYSAIKARKADVEVALSMISLDFECSPTGELYSVGLYGAESALDDTSVLYQKVIMVGQPQLDDPVNQEGKAEGASKYIQWVENEIELIHELIAWFNDYDPDVIIGWAVVTFDLALLYRRCQLHKIALLIGRAGTELSWKVEDKFRPETLSLPGRVVLDGIDWIKAAFYQFERYSLEHVSQHLLNEGKAIDHVENRGQEICHLFAHNKPALAIYNLTDCRLVWDIFKKTQLLSFALERATLTGLEFGRVGASVAAFNNLYLPHLHRSGYVAPARAASNGLESPGGYVMDSIPGFYKDVLVLDFKSLYPSIIRTFLIDPKGLVEAKLQAEDTTVPGFLEARFSRVNPILPSLIAKLAEQRELAKLHQDKPLSQAIKIIMNSLYGVLGSKGCVFHDAKLASSITMRGHQIMKQTKTWIEEAGYKVIYGDTDSTFVWLGENHQIEDINSLGSELATLVTKKWRQTCIEQYQIDSFLELEFESHFNQFVMPTLRGSDAGSKKRYVGASKDSEGQLELTFKGMEQVRSDWSPVARRVQYHLYFLLFTQGDVKAYIQQELEKLENGDLDDELVFRKRLKRHVEEYMAKSSPHVKAAIRLVQITGDTKAGKRGKMIEYRMTLNGAQPIEALNESIDYQYYVEKQIKPIAEPVLALLGEGFDSLNSNQMMLI